MAGRYVAMMRPMRWRRVHAIGAPAAFLTLALTPVFSIPYPIRASLGLLVWMSWWWIGQPVHLAVTAFLPLVVLALFNFLPVSSILPAYAQELVILLLGANILATLWMRWGLDRRIALVSLIGVGTSTRRQVSVWFGIAALLSSILPNTVVAVALMPIVLAMLRFIGISDTAKSMFGSMVLIAVAWGTSVGGSGTPLGGAPNLLTVQMLETELLDHEFLFTTWVLRMLPLTFLVGIISLFFIRYAFQAESERVEGTDEYFAQELRSLGRMSIPERWGLALFALATLLAFTRQFYASALPGMTPAFAFLAFAVLSFALRHNGEPLLRWDYAQAHMVWGLIYLFAGGSALGQILSETGTAQFLADRMLSLVGGGGLTAVASFVVLTLVLTQITSNTAAIAIVVPITISTFQKLGMNPIPFVYIVAAAGNYGIMLPSSSGGSAVAAGYGVDLKLMFARGFWLVGLILIAITAAGYLLATYWPSFGVA